MSENLLTAPLTITRPRDLAPLAVGLRDAARMLGVSDRHLATLARAGEVPSVMIGGRRLFRLATLDAWLADRETAAVPATATPTPAIDAPAPSARPLPKNSTNS